MKLGKQDLFSSKGYVYIIPDLHGELDKIKSLIKKIDLKEEDHLVFLGDYIGNNFLNLETLKFLQEVKNNHPNTFFIKGNHDHTLVKYLKNPDLDYFAEKDNILKELENKGLKPSHKSLLKYLKNKQITFLDELLPYYETELILITHAPLNHKTASLYSKKEGFLEKLDFDLMFDFVNPDEENFPIRGIEKWLICGHQNNFSNRDYPSVYKESKRVFLDCGVGYNEKAKLYSIRFPDKKIISHQN